MFLYSKWCELSLATRNKIALEFGIEKKGPTEVFSNTIKSDGFMIKDIETALSLHNLQKYFDTNEESLPILWDWLIDKMEGREITMKADMSTLEVMQPIEESKPIETKVISNDTKHAKKKNKK